MDRSFEKEFSAYKEKYISPKNKVLQSSHSPELSSYSPDFRFNTSPSPMKDPRASSIMDERSKSNSRAVANCIRALTEKLAVLESENQQLKRQGALDKERAQREKEEILQRMEEDQKQFAMKNRKLNEYQEEIQRCGQRILILEDQNKKLSGEYARAQQEANVIKKDLEYEANKTQKLENTLNKFKSEVKENEERNSSIEFGKVQLKSELEEAQLLISQLQREVSLYRGSDKQKQNQTFYESHKVREMEYKNKFLQDLADTQQKEIEQLRKEIDILRSTVSQLEESKDVLMEQNRQNEQYLKETSEMNVRLTGKMRSNEDSKSLRKSRHTHSHVKKQSIDGNALEREIEEIDRRYKGLWNSGRAKNERENPNNRSNSYKSFN